jgi:dTDP-4-dehydrorhamnose 3,5-epimerase
MDDPQSLRHTAQAAASKDSQTVVAGGRRAAPPRIAGVQILDLGNVLTRSGWMTEVFRRDWPVVSVEPRQVNWALLNPGAVTDWHRHARQTDHLVGVSGGIKLALWDGRPDSPTTGESDVIRFGALRPVLVVVPPGVWHALRNESGEPAGYINVTNGLYDHENPDNWRSVPGSPGIPDIL